MPGPGARAGPGARGRAGPGGLPAALLSGPKPAWQPRCLIHCIRTRAVLVRAGGPEPSHCSGRRTRAVTLAPSGSGCRRRALASPPEQVEAARAVAALQTFTVTVTGFADLGRPPPRPAAERQHGPSVPVTGSGRHGGPDRALDSGGSAPAESAAPRPAGPARGLAVHAAQASATGCTSPRASRPTEASEPEWIIMMTVWP